MSHAAMSLGSLLIVCGAALFAALPARGDDFPDRDKLPVIKELPDPLLMLDGTRITSKEDWNSRRKPELKALFQHYMYGYFPAATKITASVDREDADAVDGKASMKQVTIAFGPAGCPPIHLLLIVPKHHEGRSPAVFLGINFEGNHTVMADSRIALSAAWVPGPPNDPNNHHPTEASRGHQADRWQVPEIIGRGYALATFCYGDVSPDEPGNDEGVFPFFRQPGQTAPGPTDWGAIATWAYGAHRVVDYLLTEPAIDGRRIIVFGHSRLGKTALVAGAFDDRIAAVIAHQAGCGGSAPDRRHNEKSEPVARINKAFPHWFDAVFKEFSDHEDQLPFDQHCLVGICAPRPVLFTCGHADQWADPAGELEVLRAAGPVYKLFGLDGIPAGTQPEDDKILGSSLCYYIRESPHTVDKAYWDAFLDFADRAVPAKK